MAVRASTSAGSTRAGTLAASTVAFRPHWVVADFLHVRLLGIGAGCRRDLWVLGAVGASALACLTTALSKISLTLASRLACSRNHLWCIFAALQVCETASFIMDIENLL